MATVVGIRGTTIVGSETTAVRDVADRIALLQPEAAPLVTFTSALKRKKETNAVKFEWFEDDLVPNYISAGGAVTASDVTMTISAGDRAILRIGDVLVPVSGAYTWLVTNLGATTATFTRASGDTTSTAASADQLVIAGNACDEGQDTPSTRTTQKVPKSNYVQIFRDPVRITVTADAIKQYGGSDRMFQRKKMAIEHKRGIEGAFLFGAQRTDAGSYGGNTTTTKGLLNWISTNVTDVGGVLTEAELETFLRGLFRYVASESAGTKVLFASPILISAVNFWAKNALQVRSDEKTYGMRIATYRSGHGDIDIVRHWMLADFTEFTKYGFFVDPSLISYRYLPGLDTKLHLDIGLKTSETYVDEYRTHAGFQLELEKAHGVLKNITGYAA